MADLPYLCGCVDTPEEQLNRSENANLFRLVYAYRSYGHLAADLDPLHIQKAPYVQLVGLSVECWFY
jgi:2-oxoglutarate dehydrogenase complex dehydrogenase (E1) component-like enzyme